MQKSEQNAFPCPIGTHYHSHTTAVYHQVDAIDYTLAASLEGEAFDFNWKRKADLAIADALEFGDRIKHRRDV